MTTVAYPDQAYGALTAYLRVGSFTLEQAFQHLESLIAGDAWRRCGPGFDDINAFMDSIRLDKFKVLADERQRIVNRIRELQPAVSNRQIGRTLGVAHTTVDRDLGTNVPDTDESANENNGAPEDAGTNVPSGPHHLTQRTGDNEWFTPPQYLDLVRWVMGAIDLDPASHPLAQRTVNAGRFFTKNDDGLKQEWRGRVWLNPPYERGLIDGFVAKLVGELSAGRVEQAILLTNNSGDTDWFLQAGKAAAAVCITHGRIRFLNPARDDEAPLQGQAFFYFGADPLRFAEAFGKVGLVWPRHIAAP
jgi:ParB family chromosome partitioning protein